MKNIMSLFDEELPPNEVQFNVDSIYKRKDEVEMKK